MEDRSGQHDRGERPRPDDHPDMVEARRRIEEFVREGGGRFSEKSNEPVTMGMLYLASLHITSADLAALGPYLQSLKQLTKLYLNDNQLTSNPELAAALSPLTHLTGLDLSFNQLTSTPHLEAALSPLTHLRGLRFTDNELTSTPDLAAALSPLKQLTEFWLSSNQLTSTPDLAAALSPLKQLTTLWLNYNQLTSTPDLAAALSPLNQLTRLGLNSNQLTSTPDLAAALNPLNQLTTLFLDDNQLTSTPDLAAALNPLNQLTTLGLDDNQLTSTPDLAAALSPQKQLTRLSLDDNQLTSTPDLAAALSPLKQLTELSLDDNQLTSTPDLAAALSPLNQLTRLSLTANLLRLSGILETALVRDGVVALIAAIRAAAARQVGVDPRVKVVILGQGRVGKTQLRRRLAGESPEAGAIPTHSFDWAVMSGQSAASGGPAAGDRPSRRGPKKVPPEVAGDVARQAVPWPPGLAAPTAGPDKAAVPTRGARVDLFDFGGQESLWASHRFFLGTRRTVYVICVPAVPIRVPIPTGKSYEEDGRLAYWLAYVKDHYEQSTRREATEQWRARSAFAGTGKTPMAQKMGMRGSLAGGSDETFEAILQRVRAETPMPPVIVVRTFSAKVKADGDSVGQRGTSDVQALCARYGATLVDGYDSFDDPDGTRLGRVVDMLRKTVQEHPALRSVWTDLWPLAMTEAMESLRTKVGFDDRSGSFNPRPAAQTLPVEGQVRALATRLAELEAHANPGAAGAGPANTKVKPTRRGKAQAKTVAGPEPTLSQWQAALGFMRIICDLGVLHWVGTASAHEARGGANEGTITLHYAPRGDIVEPSIDHADRDALYRTLISPAWVRGPVYNLLWRDPGDGASFPKPLTVTALHKRLADDRSVDAAPKVNHNDIPLLHGLVEACGLIVKVAKAREEEPDSYFVPDLHDVGAGLDPSAQPVLLRGQARRRLDLGFVADSFFAHLVGKLVCDHTLVTVRRTSATLTWNLPGGVAEGGGDAAPVTITLTLTRAADGTGGVLWLDTPANLPETPAIAQEIARIASDMLNRHGAQRLVFAGDEGEVVGVAVRGGPKAARMAEDDSVDERVFTESDPDLFAVDQDWVKEKKHMVEALVGRALTGTERKRLSTVWSETRRKLTKKADGQLTAWRAIALYAVIRSNRDKNFKTPFPTRRNQVSAYATEAFKWLGEKAGLRYEEQYGVFGLIAKEPGKPVTKEKREMVIAKDAKRVEALRRTALYAAQKMLPE